MTTNDATDHPIPNEAVVDAIERLSVEAVGITALALSQGSPDPDLSLLQWRALVVIGERQPVVRVGEIAEQIGSAIPTTSRLLRRLEARGLITTARDEGDRRATLVRLTVAGAHTRDSVVRHRRQIIREALRRRPIGADPRLGVLLQQIAEALRG